MTESTGAHDLNPMAQHEVEQEIRRLSNELTSQTEEHAKAGEDAAAADIAYDLARAKALLATPKLKDGEKMLAAEREAEALIAVEGEYTDARMTAAIFEATRERGRNLRCQLDALRSINANVRAAVDYSYGRGS